MKKCNNLLHTAVSNVNKFGDFILLKFHSAISNFLDKKLNKLNEELYELNNELSSSELNEFELEDFKKELSELDYDLNDLDNELSSLNELTQLNHDSKSFKDFRELKTKFDDY